MEFYVEEMIGPIYEVTDLEKSRSHRYIKRTGTPGNYRYWYRMPDGRITDDEAMQDHGRLEHVKRLLAGRGAGVHTSSHAQIAERTGLPLQRVRDAASNMRRSSISFETHHLHEAIAEPNHPSYAVHAERVETPAEDAAPAGEATPAAPRARRPRESSGARRSREDAARAAASESPARGEAAAIAENAAKNALWVNALWVHRAGYVSNGGGHFIHPNGAQLQILENGKWKARKDAISDGGGIVPGVWGEEASTPQAAIRKQQQAANRASGLPEHAPHSSLESSHGLSPTPAATPTPAASPADNGALVDADWSQFDSMGVSTNPDGDLRIISRILDGRNVFTLKLISGTSARHLGNYVTIREAIDNAAERWWESIPLGGVLPTPESSHRSPTPTSRPTAEAEKAEKIAKLRAKLATHGIHLESPAAVENAAETARKMSRRIREATHPDSRPETPASRELSRDPDFGVSEAEIVRAIADQTAGGNPYLAKAQDIFHRIHGDIKPDRKKAIDNFFASLEAVKTSGAPITKEAILAHYKTLPGNERKRTLPSEDVERGTFHTMDEIINNPPLNAEVERMKRGYAAKQFQRIRPFLKQAWADANPSAPPPMPTFGDVKTWAEHGGTKPSWAGTTKLALPEEVFQAAHKSPDGKPKYPPAGMPIHLMPVWNYVAKSMESHHGASIWEFGAVGSPYAAGKMPAKDQASPTGWNLNMGNQASSTPEGMLVSAMRKYVQMRGGVENLVDIPSNKLSDSGLTHRDIFKSPNLTDAQIMNIARHKIVDPVGLTAILRKDFKKMRKSFSLVVDSEEVFIPSGLKKSDPISRIKEILSARGV